MTHPTPARWRVDDERAHRTLVLMQDDTFTYRYISADQIVREHNALVRMIEEGPLWGHEYATIVREALGLEPTKEAE